MVKRIVLVFLLGGFLAACGARGALEPPPDAPKDKDAADREIILDPLIR